MAKLARYGTTPGRPRAANRTHLAHRRRLEKLRRQVAACRRAAAVFFRLRAAPFLVSGGAGVLGRRDPAVGPCDAYEADDCCLARREVTSDQLTPWNEDLILTLRGPMRVPSVLFSRSRNRAVDQRLV